MDLLENEHTLESPEMIGDDSEKINCIHYWAEIVGLLRSMNATVVSFDNKINILNAIKKELELIETELRNDPSYPVQHADGSTDMVQVPAADDEVIDLSKSGDMSPMQMAQAARIQRDNLTRLKRAAGIIDDQVKKTP